MRATMVRGGAAVVAGVILLVAAATPAWAAPALTADPGTDLVDGQTITVRGSGYPAGVQVAVVQCGPGGEVGIDDCDISGFRTATTDSAGSFTAEYQVRRILRTPKDERIDCAIAPFGTCVVGANQYGSGPTATAPLGFDPDVPPRPPLEVGVEITSASVADNVVRLDGVIRCNRPSFVFAEGRVRQVVRRFFIDGEFAVETRCEGETPFTAVIEGRTGEFRRGDAEVLVDVFASDGTGEFDDVTLEQEIQLQPK